MDLLHKHNIYIVPMSDVYTHKQLAQFQSFIDSCQWNSNVPGGFLTNSPQRLVNSFGTGATVSECGKLNDDGWPAGSRAKKIEFPKMTFAINIPIHD